MQTGVLIISRQVVYVVQLKSCRHGVSTVSAEMVLSVICHCMPCVTVIMPTAGLQVDGCFADPTQYNITYPDLGFALNKSGRAMVYSCSWPAYLPDPVQTSYQVSDLLTWSGQAFGARNCHPRICLCVHSHPLAASQT